MSNLSFQSTLICTDLGETRRQAKAALEICCPHCKPLLELVESKITDAYVRAEEVDLLKGIHEFEDKHPIGTPLNQHLRRRKKQLADLHAELDGRRPAQRERMAA